MTMKVTPFVIKKSLLHLQHKTAFLKQQATSIYSIQNTKGHMRLSQEPAVTETVFDDDIGYSVEHKLNIVSVRCNGELSVDVFGVSASIQSFKLLFNVNTRLVVRIAACKYNTIWSKKIIYWNLILHQSYWTESYTMMSQYKLKISQMNENSMACIRVLYHLTQQVSICCKCSLMKNRRLPIMQTETLSWLPSSVLACTNKSA